MSAEKPTFPELLEQHGLEGEALIRGVMELTSTTREGAIDQIRSSRGEYKGDQRVIRADS